MVLVDEQSSADLRSAFPFFFRAGRSPLSPSPLLATFFAFFRRSPVSIVPIADAQISAGASGFFGDLDTYIVTFSGESDSSAGAWEIEAEVSINGGAFANINPTGPNTFQFGKQTNSPSMTWCTRVQATASAVFRMHWRHIDGGTANLDDYTMTVRRLTSQ